MQLLVEDRLTDEQIAEECCVNRRTLTNWKQHPEFKAEYNGLLKQWEQRVTNGGIANRNRRLERLTDRWEREDTG